MSVEEAEKPQEQDQQKQKYKIVLLGDDGAGKTSLCQYYKEPGPVSTDLPVIIPSFAKKEFVGEQKVILEIWDSACSDEYDEIRQRSYTDVSFYLLCFALDDFKTLQHLVTKWQPEIAEKIGDAKIFVVATKCDERKLTDKEIAPLRKKLSPRQYIECSSKTGENVQFIFDQISKLILTPEAVPEPVADDDDAHKKDPALNDQKSTCCNLI